MTSNTGRSRSSFSFTRILFVGLACAFVYSFLATYELMMQFYQTPTFDETFSSAVQALANRTPHDIVALVEDNTAPYFPENEGIDRGFLSERPTNFFRVLQREIDVDDNTERCKRYGFSYNPTKPMNRRIFYGAMIASKPWELFEIVGAETHAIFAGVVFVEANRTQNFSFRNFTRLHHENTFQRIFGVNNLQIRAFVNEDSRLRNLDREQMQRAEILKGWKDLGMQKEDIGFLTDADEIFTRDYLRAVQVCVGIDALDYNKHQCKPPNGLRAATLVFETSPECLADGRAWFHPDMLNGHCIEEIGNETIHPKAPRRPNSFLRVQGYGYQGDSTAIKDNSYPLYNAADFRRIGGIWKKLQEKQYPSYSYYTGFHFHNFFTRPDALRFKYRTYGKYRILLAFVLIELVLHTRRSLLIAAPLRIGHPDPKADRKKLEELSRDVAMMVNCVKNVTDAQEAEQEIKVRGNYKLLRGGFKALKPFVPI